MNTDQIPPPSTISAIIALAKLEEHLCTKQIEMLASLLDGVKGETGYGEVKIIIADKRVVSLKAEKSY